MEQSKKYTIIMTHDGLFHKAKRLKRAEVGMEVHFQPLHASKIKQTFFLHRTRFAAVTMAFLLTLFPTFYWFEDNKAFAYVSVDINPSVELEVNSDMEVLDIQSLNDDAEKLVSKLDGWKNKPVAEIALEMISISQNEGYMKLGREVLIGVSYIKEGDFDLSNEIEVFLNNELEGLMLASYNVPNTVHQRAEQENTSVNKLMAESLDGENDKFHLDSGVIENEDRAIIQAFYNDGESLHPEKEKGSDDSQKLESDESSQIPVNDSEGAPDQHPHSVPQPSAQVKYSETNPPDKPDKDQVTPGTAGKEKTPNNDKQSKKRPLSNSNSEEKGNHKLEKKAKSRTDTVDKQSEKKNNLPSKKDENKTDKSYSKNNEKGKADKDQDKKKDKSKTDKDQDKDKDKIKAGKDKDKKKDKSKAGKDQDRDKDKNKSKVKDKGKTKEKDKNEGNDKRDKSPTNEKQKKDKNNNNGNNNGNEKKK
nr:anti-sigma factor domain-containing protein [Halobacillus sp. A1]